MTRTRYLLLTLLMTVLLTACPNARKEEKALDTRLDAFASEVRWGEDMERVFAFFDPAKADTLRPKPLELERWKQYRIIGYREQPVVFIEPRVAQQRAELELVNRHTQITRTLRMTTEWRYDETAERWHLVSPLPLLAQ